MTDNSDARVDLEIQYSRQPHMDNTCHALYAPFVECERERGHVDKCGDIAYDPPPAAEPGRVEVNSSGQTIGGSDGQPQRVALPDPTPPIVWTAADDEAWRPERITFNDAEYVRAQPPKADAAETDALTDSERADMHERNKHPHRHDSTCPTCDYPERVTPNGARAIAEQAAARGRDEALAVVHEVFASTAAGSARDWRGAFIQAADGVRELMRRGGR